MEEAESNMMAAYVGSKILAEKAAWSFVEKEKPNFSLSTVRKIFYSLTRPLD